MLGTIELKQELRDAVTKHFLVGLDEAADTEKVIYHSQVLVDRIN